MNLLHYIWYHFIKLKCIPLWFYGWLVLCWYAPLHDHYVSWVAEHTPEGKMRNVFEVPTKLYARQPKEIELILWGAIIILPTVIFFIKLAKST